MVRSCDGDTPDVKVCSMLVDRLVSSRRHGCEACFLMSPLSHICRYIQYDRKYKIHFNLHKQIKCILYFSIVLIPV